eukprot:scaffold12969_cov65-Attheya_sp.AAC.6
MKFTKHFRMGCNGIDISDTSFAYMIPVYRHPSMPEAKKKLFKCKAFLEHHRLNCQMMWDTGADLSIDEQTLGFQGQDEDKLRITYKKVGDGFQCDAICEDGYHLDVVRDVRF